MSERASKSDALAELERVKRAAAQNRAKRAASLGLAGAQEADIWAQVASLSAHADVKKAVADAMREKQEAAEQEARRQATEASAQATREDANDVPHLEDPLEGFDLPAALDALKDRRDTLTADFMKLLEVQMAILMAVDMAESRVRGMSPSTEDSAVQSAAVRSMCEAVFKLRTSQFLAEAVGLDQATTQGLLAAMTNTFFPVGQQKDTAAARKEAASLAAMANAIGALASRDAKAQAQQAPPEPGTRPYGNTRSRGGPFGNNL